MPRQSKTDKKYEPAKKNPISLADDSNIDNDLKVIKVGDKNSILELSKDKLIIRGTIDADAISVNGASVQTGTDAGATELNELSDVTYSSGDLTISSLYTIITTDTLTLDAEGRLYFNANGGRIIFQDDAADIGEISNDSGSIFLLYNISDSGDFLRLATGSRGDTTISTRDGTGSNSGHLRFEPSGSFLIKEVASAGADVTAYGQIWVKNSTPNELYFTTDAGDDIQLTSGTSAAGGGGGTQYWNQMLPGYVTNKSSTTLYYTFYRGWYESWGNSDSSPTTIADTDSYSCFFIAPRAGTITNLKIQGYATDTGATDPFKFYFYKGAMTSDADSMSLSLMFNSGTITPPSAHKTWTADVDVSSSNSFAENDCLYCFWKKDSNSGNQDVYWHMNISGEYD